MTAGEKIREARLAKGWTQEELAQKLGPDAKGKYSTKHTIYRWESGAQVPQRRLLALLAALDIAPGYLLEKRNTDKALRNS